MEMQMRASQHLLTHCASATGKPALCPAPFAPSCHKTGSISEYKNERPFVRSSRLALSLPYFPMYSPSYSLFKVFSASSSSAMHLLRESVQ